MSSPFLSTTTSVDAHSSREDDGLGRNNHLPTTPYDISHLSPYNPHTLSNSTSPSYTPGDSGYSNYQPSEFSEVEDPFFGVNFDDGVQRVDSLPLALAGTITYQTLLNRRPTDPPARKTLSAAVTNPAYPLSPSQSSNSNTPPPKGATTELKGQTTISQHELTTELHNSRFQAVNSLAPIRSTVVQLTPDQSGSSHTSAEDIKPSTMSRPENSPPIMVSEWGQSQQQSQTHDFMPVDYAETNDNTFESAFLNQGMGQAPIARDDDGAWTSSLQTGYAGLDPTSRRNLLEAELPTLKEQEEQRRIEYKNIEVEEWRSQAGGSDDGNEEPSQSYFPLHSEDLFQQTRSRPNEDEETPNIPPLDDDALSIHENRLVEGQTYFSWQNANLNEADKRLMMQSRHWNDAPSYPSATATNEQPATANEAIMRFYRNADTMSIASRAATWGTRRRSEPSLPDWESVADGNLLKKLSISKPSGRSRKDSFFDQGLDRLANIVPNMVRKRSDAKLKRARSSQNIPEEPQLPPNPRHNSQGSLLVPSRTLSVGKKQQTPNISTTIAAMASPLAAVGTTHARNGSISANLTSPKSPSHLGFANRIINRARSKSDLSIPNDRGHSGIANLWRVNGGPPVATLATPQAQPEVALLEKRPLELDEDDDEDDDEQGDEGDMKVDAELDPIVPNYEGFKAHVRRLNPDMDTRYNWLVSRIAHQQEIRYKNLLDLRVKHSQAINAQNCSAGSHCLGLGGSITLTDAKGNVRESNRQTPGLQLVTDFADDDSNPGEGALTDQTFPHPTGRSMSTKMYNHLRAPMISARIRSHLNGRPIGCDTRMNGIVI
jgi:hypothetical protein